MPTGRPCAPRSLAFSFCAAELPLLAPSSHPLRRSLARSVRYAQVFSSRYNSNPNATRVFLMTDSPEVRSFIERELAARFGVSTVQVREGDVQHCGPNQSITDQGVLRMLTEWSVARGAKGADGDTATT